ncbi:MAG: rRNA pseudouridine synthase [Planctomycetes bacterium]|nr:rRNA pseudouridine synthase [Planctomycetota bacterium]
MKKKQESPPSAAPDPAGPAESPRLVRLNKFLAEHGVAARRRCDELIAEGKVSVDGEPARELGLKIDPTRQEVEVDGFVFKARSARRRYYVLNKPSGVVCTNEARETRPRAVDLITDPFKGRIYTVGRLDEESKGLVLLTNDGDFAHRIQHPRYGVEKTYLVKVSGEIDDAALKEIREGVHLSEGRTAGARIVVHDRGRSHSLLSVSIREGMNREIRRVFARFGFKVTELKRIRIGALTDRGLKPGRWRELAPAEVAALLANEPARAAAIAANPKPSGARRGRGGELRPRGAAPLGQPKRRGYARHLVQGGRAVERRPDAPPRFAERGLAGGPGVGGRRGAGSPRGPSTARGPGASRGAGGAARYGPAKKPKVGRTQRGGGR